MKLAKGTRIYYTGDMANLDGFGEITEELPAGKYAPAQVKIKMDDGREFTTFKMGFSEEYKGHCGTRFVTEWAYRKFRHNQIKELQAVASR